MHYLVEASNNRYFVTIPPHLRRELKKFIPSAKWSYKRKQWGVGCRSGEKLSTWVADNYGTIYASITKNASDNRLSKKVPLMGGYNCKALLKSQYLAEYGTHNRNTGWYVDPESVEAATRLILDTNHFINISNTSKIQNLPVGASVIDRLKGLESLIGDFYIHNANVEHSFRHLPYTAQYRGTNFKLEKLLNAAEHTQTRCYMVVLAIKNNLERVFTHHT